LVANGHDVAVVGYHVSDNLSNTYSEARANYYQTYYIPDTWFDGVINLGIGNYNQFLAKVNQRLAIPSSFSISINGSNDGLDYTVAVAVENVETYAGTNIVLQFVVTESEVWEGGTKYNFVTRYMDPNQFGTPLDFSVNSTQTIMLEFSLNGSWITDNCEFVAFVQDNDTHEVLQGTKVAVPDLMPMYYNNAACQKINMVPKTNCSGDVAPKITIANKGATNLTSLDINYKINEEGLNTYQWTGDLSFGESEQVVLPAATFDILNNNDLIVYTTNPNGNDDEDTSNDTIATTFTSAIEVIPAIVVFIKLDDNPEETTWDCKNSAGQVLYSGGPYTTQQEYIYDTLFLTENDCYTFAIYDEAGDGLVGGSSGFALKENYTSMFYYNYDFEDSDELVQFAINQVSVTEFGDTEKFSVYPNPFEDYTYVSFTLSETESIDMTVYNVVGEIVYSSQQKEMGTGYHKLLINTEEFTSGVYFVNLKVGDKIFTKKIFTY
jgi:hypothetical protein